MASNLSAGASPKKVNMAAEDLENIPLKQHWLRYKATRYFMNCQFLQKQTIFYDPTM